MVFITPKEAISGIKILMNIFWLSWPLLLAIIASAGYAGLLIWALVSI